MKRRTALSAILAGGSALLPGCSLNSRTVHREPATAEKFTRTSTRTGGEATTPAETESTPTRRRGDVPTDRIFERAAVSENEISVTGDRWFARESIPYRDGSDEVDTIESERGWFVAYEFTIENVGDEPVDSLPDSEFLLGIDGDTYDHIHSLPGDVPFDAIEHTNSDPRIRPLAWYDTLAAGEATALQLVYEAPKRPDYRHYLVWDHGGPVEGHEAAAYLRGRFESGSSG